jgi:hypothetical protein
MIRLFMLFMVCSFLAGCSTEITDLKIQTVSRHDLLLDDNYAASFSGLSPVNQSLVWQDKLESLLSLSTHTILTYATPGVFY